MCHSRKPNAALVLLEEQGWGWFLLELPPSDMAFCGLSAPLTTMQWFSLWLSAS